MIQSTNRQPQIVEPSQPQNLQEVKVEISRNPKNSQRRGSKALQKQMEYNKGSFYDASQIAIISKNDINTDSLVPPPLDTLNLEVKGKNSLGGKSFYAAFPLPLSPFIKAVANTPSSSQDLRIIPWDNFRRDFVYQAINSNLFGSLITLEQIKQVYNIE